jgi:hypothetical protein
VTLRIPIVVAVIGVATASFARADNCIDAAKLRAGATGRPCWEVGTSFGGVELLGAPGFVEVRAQVLRIGLFDLHGRGRGFSVETFDLQMLDDEVDRDGDYDLDRTAWSGLGARYQIDRADWGAYVQGHLVSRWFGDMRYIIPSVALRVGAFDDAAVIAEARFAGLAAGGIATTKRSATSDLDVGLRATLALCPSLRLEARARYRDLVASDGHQVRDVVAAVGVELAIAQRDGFRVMPLFIGAGVRRSLLDTAPMPLALEGVESPGGVREATQFLVWLDLDFAINSSREVW